jgi:histidinol-phosphate aminotransferase
MRSFIYQRAQSIVNPAMNFRKELIDLKPYTPGEQPNSSSAIIKLNTNENPYPPSPKCKIVAQEIFDKGLLRKYPNPVSEDLRKSIANTYGIKSDEIFVTNGSDEGIRLLFAAIIKSDSIIASPDPTYSAYPVFADTAMENYLYTKIPLLEDFSFDWSALKNSKADLVAFANPNAPTSLLESKKSVLSFVDSFSGFVLCDEAYIDFSDEGSSCIQEAGKCDNLFVSRTFSKSYSLAGLRVGFLVGSAKNISLLHKIKDSYNVGMLDQAIAKAALEDKEYFQETTRKIIKTRIYLTQKLEELGCKIEKSSTNFLFLQPPFPYKAADWFEALKKENIYVRYFPTGRCSDYLRITIGTDLESDLVVEAIRKFLS